MNVFNIYCFYVSQTLTGSRCAKQTVNIKVKSSVKFRKFSVATEFNIYEIISII